MGLMCISQLFSTVLAIKETVVVHFSSTMPTIFDGFYIVVRSSFFLALSNLRNTYMDRQIHRLYFVWGIYIQHTILRHKSRIIFCLGFSSKFLIHHFMNGINSLLFG